MGGTSCRRALTFRQRTVLAFLSSRLLDNARSGYEARWSSIVEIAPKQDGMIRAFAGAD